MSTAGAARFTVASVIDGDGDEDVQPTVVVRDCNRIGLRANPPGFSWTGLFRRVRRRR